MTTGSRHVGRELSLICRCNGREYVGRQAENELLMLRVVVGDGDTLK